MAGMTKEEQDAIIRQLLTASGGPRPRFLATQEKYRRPVQGPLAPMQGLSAPMPANQFDETNIGAPRFAPATPQQRAQPASTPSVPVQANQFDETNIGAPRFASYRPGLYDEFNEGAPRFAPATAQQRAQPASAPSAPMQGPINMNVIKFLNQYANMGAPQEYADKFAGGDLSKIQARTYRDEEGNPYNDYYTKGLLGG